MEYNDYKTKIIRKYFMVLNSEYLPQTQPQFDLYAFCFGEPYLIYTDTPCRIHQILSQQNQD